MKQRPLLRSCVRAMVVTVLLAPALAWADPGFEFKPSIALTQVHDDNLFNTAADRETDAISRLTPGLEVNFKGRAMALLSRYTFDAEAYRDHPDLNNTRTRQHGALGLRLAPEGDWTLALDGAYDDTHTPTELNLQTGFLASRALARRVTYGPTLTHRGAATSGSRTGYLFTRDEIEGGSSIETQVASLSIDRAAGPRSVAHIDVAFRRYDFQEGERVESQVFTLGVTRETSPLTRFTLRAGPRVTDGRFDPEVLASVRHELRHGEIGGSYTNSQTTIIGRIGTTTYQSLTVEAVYQATRSLKLGLTPGVVRLKDDQDGTGTRVYRGGFDMKWAISRWASLVGSYEFTLQRATPDPSAREIARNLATLSFVAAVP